MVGDSNKLKSNNKTLSGGLISRRRRRRHSHTSTYVRDDIIMSLLQSPSRMWNTSWLITEWKDIIPGHVCINEPAGELFHTVHTGSREKFSHHTKCLEKPFQILRCLKILSGIKVHQPQRLHRRKNDLPCKQLREGMIHTVSQNHSSFWENPGSL
jgi:hypothetical protein